MLTLGKDARAVHTFTIEGGVAHQFSISDRFVLGKHHPSYLAKLEKKTTKKDDHTPATSLTHTHSRKRKEKYSKPKRKKGEDGKSIKKTL